MTRSFFMWLLLFFRPAAWATTQQFRSTVRLSDTSEQTVQSLPLRVSGAIGSWIQAEPPRSGTVPIVAWNRRFREHPERTLLREGLI
jgi:hypothetical protein